MFAVPAFGMNVNIAYLISLLFVLRLQLSKQRLNLYILLLFLSVPLVIIVFVEPSKWLGLLVMEVALITVLYDKYKSNALKGIFYILICSISFSYLSLFFTGVDFIPEFLYGESRHTVGAFEYVNYRPSGFYQEPSTLAYHLLLLAFLFDLVGRRYQLKLETYVLSCVFFSFLTLSPSALVGLVFFRNVRAIKVRYRIPLFIASIIVVFSVIQLLLYKLDVYTSVGLSEVIRYKALVAAFQNNLIFGLSPSEISHMVIYDNGPIISLLLYFGYLSIPVLLFLFYVLLKDWRFIALLIIKIPFTSPLLWMVATSIIVYDNHTSSRQVRIP